MTDTLVPVTYDIATIPVEKSDIVLEQRKRVLANFDFEQLKKDLAIVADLLYVAYCGVGAYGDLRGAMGRVQSDYLTACRKTQSAMNDFVTKCDQILERMPLIFEYLKKSKVEVALEYLHNMVEVATGLKTSALDLQNVYEALRGQVLDVKMKTETKLGDETKAKKEMAKAWEHAKNERKLAQQLKEQVDESIAEMQKLYEEAVAKAEKMEDRAFALELVGAIMKPLGQAVGVAGALALKANMPPDLSDLVPKASSPSTGSTASPEKPTTTSAKPDDKKPDDKKADENEKNEKPEVKEARKEKNEAETNETNAEKELNKKKKAVSDLNDEITKLDNKIDEATNKIKDKSTGAADKKTLNEQKAKDENSKIDAEAKLDTAKTEEAAAQTDYNRKHAAAEEARNKYNKIYEAIGKLGDSIDKAGDKVGALGATLADLAKLYHEKQKQYFNAIKEQKVQQQKLFADIARFGNTMASLRAGVQYLNIVLAALEVAVAALQRIDLILNNAAMFWAAMATGCEAMSSDSSLVTRLVHTATKKAVVGVEIANKGKGQTKGTYTITDSSSNFKGGPGKVEVEISGGAITKAKVIASGSDYTGAPSFQVTQGGTPGSLVGVLGSVQEKLTEFFADQNNLKLVVTLYARWVAVKSISAECGTNAREITRKAEANIGQPLKVERMLEVAQTKGKELKLEAQAAQKEVNDEIALIEAEMMKTDALATTTTSGAAHA